MKQQGDILVVEDHEVTLGLIVDVLTVDGYRVRPANSGGLALKSARAHMPDLILLDIRMPGMDGFEVFERLQELPGYRDIPVIFLSAMSDSEERIKGLALGAVDFIVKPFHLEELRLRIRNQLELFRLRRLLQSRVEQGTVDLQINQDKLHTETRQRNAAQSQLSMLNRALQKTEKVGRIGHWTWDIQSNKVDWSDEMFRLFGIEPAVFDPDLQAIINQAIHPEDRDKVIQSNLDVMESGVTVPLEYRVIWPDRSIHWIWAEAEMLDSGANNKPLRLTGYAQDITARKQSETILKAESEYRSIILAGIADGLITTDADGLINHMNPAAERLTGWSLTEAKGLKLNRVFHLVNSVTEPTKAITVAAQLVTGTAPEIINQAFLVSRSGEMIATACSVSVLPGVTGMLNGVVVLFRDMRDQNHLFEVLQQSERQEALALLASGIAHDFNNFLSGIFGYLHMLQARLEPGSENAGYIDQAMLVFERARSLTKQLLGFAKGDTMHPAPQDMATLIRESATFALSGSKVKLELNLPTGLWPGVCDRNQIGQVIDNIVINAKQAMSGKGNLKIQAENSVIETGNHPILKPGNYLTLSFLDSGPGIPAESLRHIFDPFFTTKHNSSGLGLAMSYFKVRNHDGIMTVESPKGGGALISLVLPASPQTALTQTVNQEKVLTHQGHGRVLVLDDEKFNREVNAAMLEQLGYQVESVPDSELAMKMIREAIDLHDPFLFALVDLTVPLDLGAVHLRNQLLQERIELPCIACSGDTEDPIIREPQLAGFAGSLTKPFRLFEMKQLLNKLHISPV